LSEKTPHRRRPRYSGKHPRRFDEKYKELSGNAETLARVLASGKMYVLARFEENSQRFEESGSWPESVLRRPCRVLAGSRHSRRRDDDVRDGDSWGQIPGP